MVPSRRKLLTLCGLTVTSVGLSGCVGLGEQGSQGSIDLVVTNEDDTEHSFTVEVTEENESVFTEQFTLSSGEELQKADIVSGGDYTATVTVDSGDPESFSFDLNGCTENELYVVLMKGGELDYGMTDVCD